MRYRAYRSGVRSASLPLAWITATISRNSHNHVKRLAFRTPGSAAYGTRQVSQDLAIGGRDFHSHRRQIPRQAVISGPSAPIRRQPTGHPRLSFRPGQPNGAALAVVPARVVTVTSPAVLPAGARTMIRLYLRAMIRAGIPLNAARMARVMLWPQMVTLVPGPGAWGKPGDLRGDRGGDPPDRILVGVGEPHRPIAAAGHPSGRAERVGATLRVVDADRPAGSDTADPVGAGEPAPPPGRPRSRTAGRCHDRRNWRPLPW